MPATPHSGRRPWFTACPVGHFWGWSGVRWGVDLRTNAQVPNSETDCALCLCLRLSSAGQGASGSSRRKALLAEGMACPKVVFDLQVEGCRKGVGGTVPQRPGGQLEEQQDGGWKEPSL